MFREEATLALAGFHVDPLCWSNWNLEMLFLWREGKEKNPKKNPWSKMRTNTKVNPYDGTGLELNPGLAQMMM